MKKIIVLVLAIIAVFTSLDVVAQDMSYDVSIINAKKELTNLRSQISTVKNRVAIDSLWAQIIMVEGYLEKYQIFVPSISSAQYERGNFRQGIVKNFNDEVASFYIFNISSSPSKIKPVLLMLDPGEEIPASLSKGSYRVVITCAYYTKVLIMKIDGNNWRISSTLSASVI